MQTLTRPPAQMSDRELVETIIGRLRVQGQQALGADHGCLYRTPEGRGCAIGVVLPDDLAELGDSDSANSLIADVVRNWPAVGEWLGASDKRISLLADIQQIHDDSFNWNEYGLKVRAVQTIRNLLTEREG